MPSHPARARWSASATWLILAITMSGCGEVIVPSPTVAPTATGSRSAATTSPGATVSDSPDLMELPAPPTLALDEIPLTCGSPLVFGVEALDGMPGAEMAAHPAAENLRQFLADGSLPDRSGWRLVVLNGEGVLFLLPGTREEGVSYWNAEFGPAAAGWQPVRWGQCDLRPAFEGIEPARWELAPNTLVGRDTQALEVRVFEQACASGASPDDRIVGPAVILLEDSVIIILGTRPLPGPQTCEPGLAATVRVELPERLGDRELLDGSSFPAEPRS